MSSWESEDEISKSPKTEIEAIAEYMAKQITNGFIFHDTRKRERAVTAFAEVDIRQFPHLTEETAIAAAEAYVDALWEKDTVEDACRVNGEIDRDALDTADWSGVEAAFRCRAELVGMDTHYAELSTESWKKHKTGGDYWTPLLEAQLYEIRAALQDETYPAKPRDGQSGFGPEPVSYILGVELHDMRDKTRTISVMKAYFTRILTEHHSS